MTAVLLLSGLVGTTLILVRGTIFAPIRRLAPKFFRCSQCVGMWVGMAAGASGIVSVGQGRILDAVVVGPAASFLSLAADAVLIRLLGSPNENESEGS